MNNFMNWTFVCSFLRVLFLSFEFIFVDLFSILFVLSVKVFPFNFIYDFESFCLFHWKCFVLLLVSFIRGIVGNQWMNSFCLYWLSCCKFHLWSNLSRIDSSMNCIIAYCTSFCVRYLIYSDSVISYVFSFSSKHSIQIIKRLWHLNLRFSSTFKSFFCFYLLHKFRW